MVLPVPLIHILPPTNNCPPRVTALSAYNAQSCDLTYSPQGSSTHYDSVVDVTVRTHEDSVSLFGFTRWMDGMWILCPDKQWSTHKLILLLWTNMRTITVTKRGNAYGWGMRGVRGEFLSMNINGQHGNVADTLLGLPTYISHLRHVAMVMLSPFCATVLCCKSWLPTTSPSE